MDKEKTNNKTSMIRNSKVSDSGGKLIFENPTLCSQLLRNYSGIDILKNVRAEDIEDVTERFIPMFTEERDADVVKKVHLSDGGEMFVVSLIDHKSSVDYNVVMQLMRYMVFIWEDYEKQQEKLHPGITKTRDFKYPPILPIVYYEDKVKWNAATSFEDRIFLNDVFREFIPHFSYKLIPIDQYTKEEIIESGDELSVVMLINRLKKADEFKNLDLPEGYLESVTKDSLPDVLEVMAKVIAVLLRRISVPEDEIGNITDKIKERKMGELFANFEAYNVVETRKKARAEGVAEGREKGRKEGREELLVIKVCKKLLKNKTPEEMAEELEESVERVEEICRIAKEFAPDYPVDKIMERLEEEKNC